MDNKLRIVVALILTAIFSLAGCGGGGSSADSSDTGIGGGTTFPSKTLSWAPPRAYTDSTPLNPVTDLEVFEIYVKTRASFSSTDTPLAALQAVDPGTGTLTTKFDLANLSPFLSQHVNYYVAIRAVAKNGLKSSFSVPNSFSF